MTLALYMDEHVRRAITNGLKLRGIDVITVQEDGRTGTPDTIFNWFPGSSLGTYIQRLCLASEIGGRASGSALLGRA